MVSSITLDFSRAFIASASRDQVSLVSFVATAREKLTPTSNGTIGMSGG